MTEHRYNPFLHRLALLTAAATFPLIFMGGLVTSKQAGMSVPDWPNSYGYNMFLFPPSQWLGKQAGGVFYEHSHRLMATVVGFLSIVLASAAWGPSAKPGTRKFSFRAMVSAAVLAPAMIAAGSLAPSFHALSRHLAVGAVSASLIFLVVWLCRRPEPRSGVRWLCVGILGAVLVQGLLGGLRVVLIKLDLAIVHACFGQAFFCLASLTAVATSRWWLTAPDLSDNDGVSGLRLIRFGFVAVGLIYSQLVVGAVMRHYRAGLAITDLPLAYGKLLPPTNAEELARANRLRTFPPVKVIRAEDYPALEQLTARVTLAQVWVHFTHRIGAIFVTIAVGALVGEVLRKHRGQRELLIPAMLLCMLLIAQLTLGVLTVLLWKPADIASSHVAIGALTLMTAFVLMIRASRLYSPKFRETPAALEPTAVRPSVLGHLAGSLASRV